MNTTTSTLDDVYRTPAMTRISGRTVYHRAIDVGRSRTRRRRREDRNAAGRLARSVGPSPSIDARRAIAQLGEQQCAVAFFTFWCDYSVSDIAEILDVTDGTVRKQLARARLVEILDA